MASERIQQEIDATERKMTEETLHRLAAIVEASTDAIMAATPLKRSLGSLPRSYVRRMAGAGSGRSTRVWSGGSGCRALR